MTHTRIFVRHNGHFYMYCQQCPWHSWVYNPDGADKSWAAHINPPNKYEDFFDNTP